MKILIIANNSPWQSWPTKIAAIKAFYSPLVNLNIDIKYTAFQNIPIKSAPGIVTTFSPNGPQDTPGNDLQIDPAWVQTNITPLTTGYDIAILQMTGISQTNLPLGLFTGQLSGTRYCYSFVNGENDQYLIPDPTTPGQMISYGNEAITIIEHEISHALYNLTEQTDNTHLYFYSNQFTRILTDIKLQNTNILINLYQRLVPLLQQVLGITKSQSTMPNPQGNPIPNNPDILVPWINAKGSENNRHNVRVLCDIAGLTLHQKNIITACIEQESDFSPTVEGSQNTDGTHDWGICQFNDGQIHGTPLWIGPNAAFSSTDEVKSNPKKCVDLMISTAKAGHLNWWMSYSTKAYLKFMPNGDTAPF